LAGAFIDEVCDTFYTPDAGEASRVWDSGGCRYGWKTFYSTAFPDTLRPMIHVGIGYDVHRLVEGRKLILGGVDLHHTKGLEGHSDADVLMHAICDSVLGALGEGDIGHFFPNTDPRWKNAPSKVFLQEAARQVSFHNGKIVNVDATLMAQAPKIAPHIHAMQLNISQALGINPRRVGIKATTNEQLGFLGREEGIAAMAVAGVELPQ
jgi:2-C-methyl-D-erythritol 2,4-cyclodiphosphate synthase